jgi:tRNA threonylcarbamoyladenosine biosynthesis protein TsaE
MPAQLLQISYSLGTIENDMHQFWQCAHQYSVLAFSGQMGAGKTTFIHALCNYLGVSDTVSSPTFALVNEYHFNQSGEDKIIYHMDWYRLKDTAEAVNAGIEDHLTQKGSYSFIEWPEKAIDLLMPPYLWITIEITGPEERVMTVSLR